MVWRIPAEQRQRHSLTACNHAQPAKSKMAARGPKMADVVYKGVYSQVFRCSCQLLQNKFSDLSTTSMRKGCDGEEKNGGKKKIKTF